MADAKRDNNRIPTLLGTSNADGITPVAIWVDPVTHRLLVDYIGGTVSVDVGATTTLAPGTSATVVNTGDSTNAVFAFGVPRGAVIYSVTSIPDNSTGLDGDWAFDTTSTSYVWYKSAGVWALVNSNKGATGDPGPDGPAGPAGLTWKGTYDAGTIYSANDGVAYLGTSYIYVNVTPGSGHTPADDAYWDILALKGTDGAGSGDVIGPATNTDSYIPQWNGANSKTLKNGLAVPAGGLAGLTALGNYLPLAGGTMTGDLNITKASPTGTFTNTDASQYAQAGFQLKGNTASLGNNAGVNFLSTITDLVATVSSFVIDKVDYLGNYVSGLMSINLNTAAANFVGNLTANNLSGTNSGDSAATTRISGTINEIGYFDTTGSVKSLAVATYPSLTELSYVKGVTSSIQTQLTAAATKTGSNWTFASQAIGDLAYASSTTAYSRLAAVATGSVLISKGTGTAPAWSTLPNASNFIEGFRTQATAAGTTTLVYTDAYTQIFTGSAAQTVLLPTTSVLAGQQYFIVNQSTGLVTVQSSGANTIVILGAGTSVFVTAVVATPTTAAHWNFAYAGVNAASGKVGTFSNTLTLAGTDGSTLNVGTGGTLGTAAYTASTAYATSTQGTTADNALPKAGGTMTGKVVEAGRSEVAKTYTPSSGSQTVAIDCSVNNMHVVAGNASGTAMTFTITGATDAQPFIISILQGSGTVSTIAGWFATVRWAGGSAPTLTATLNKRDTFGFIRTGANTYDGFIIGQNC